MSLPASNDTSSTSRFSSLANKLATATAKPISAMVKIQLIDRNPEQPRKVFDEDSIDELALTIKEHGIIQPLVVKPVEAGRFLLVAGERRLRAATKAGLTEVPCVLRADISTTTALAIALIENISREPMVPTDEVSAIARLAAEVGGAEAARLLATSQAHISKCKAISESTVALEIAMSGKTTDIETLYELAQLAKTDEAGAREVVATTNEDLRSAVKAARKALKGEPAADQGEDPDEDGEELSHAKPSKKGGAAAAELAGQTSKAAAPKDAATVIVDAEKRKGRLVLITQDGDEIICAWRGEARAKTLKIIKAL
jgi:ParB family chromosome partitioning protein